MEKIQVISQELSEEEVLNALISLIDDLIKNYPGEFTIDTLIGVFHSKIQSKEFKNDGIWYEVLQILRKNDNLVEKVELKTLEKVETGIDLLSFEGDSILFSEMKSSISSISDYELANEGIKSQFTKRSKDIVQLGEFANALARQGLISESDKEIIRNLIKQRKQDLSYAGNILMNDKRSKLFEFEVSLSTSNVTEVDFIEKLSFSQKNKYAKTNNCPYYELNLNPIKSEKCNNCNELECTYNIISSLEKYRVIRDKLPSSFDLEKIYIACIEYLEEL